jgi:eukaryotic-like serine/threonine-protein kinase
MPPDDPQRPPERIGPYRILRVLGQGGMGVVYEAEQLEPVHRRVAVKMLRAGMDTGEVLARFEAERQALAFMDHPNIAKVLDVGASDGGRPYFVMELVKGMPLTDYCDANRLTVRDRVRLFVQVCRAVQHAHQKGVIHRDLKPSNVLVAEQPEPIPKVIDFGIAKAVSQRLTERTLVTAFGQTMGTPAYMSPEQAEATRLDVDTRTDIYSLGVMLYELLVGRLPLDPAKMGVSSFILAITIRGNDPPRPSVKVMEDPQQPSIGLFRQTTLAELRRQLRGDLDWIVMMAMEKDRARRYETANGLAMDLQRFLGDEAVVARPPTAGYRFGKFVRRHRFGVLSGAGVALLVTSFAVVAATQARATAHEAAKARAVKDFLVGLFQVSTPEESRGREITARELLERGARRIDSGLARQPELRADLLDVLGVIYRDLGLYPEADTLLGQAVELSRGRLGETHPEVAAKLTDWAAVLAAQGKFVRAESLLMRAHDILRARGAEDTTLSTTLNVLGSVQRQRGNFAQAESLYQIGLKLDRSPRGGDRLRVAMDLDNLGMVLQEAGKLARADSSYQEALALRRGLLDPDHPQVITSLHHLAGLREQQGEFEEAILLGREVLERRRRIYPAGHPEIAYALRSLSSKVSNQAGYAEAESLDVEALAILRERLGPDHPETLGLVSDLATLKYDRGDLAGAESAFKELLAAWRRSVGDDHPATLEALNSVAATLKYQRRYVEAEPLYRQALALRRKRLGDAHPDVGSAWGNLAELLAEKGELGEAEQAYRTSLAILRAALPSGHVYISGTLLALGAIRIDQGRAKEAEPLLRQALTSRLEKLGPDDRRTARAQRTLGLCLMALGERPEAEKLLLESYRTLAGAKNWYHQTLREHTLHDLVALYRGWGKPSEAAKYQALLTGKVERATSALMSP